MDVTHEQPGTLPPPSVAPTLPAAQAREPVNFERRMPEVDLMRNRPKPRRSFFRKALPWFVPIILIAAAAALGWYGYQESLEDDEPATPTGPVVAETPD